MLSKTFEHVDNNGKLKQCKYFIHTKFVGNIPAEMWFVEILICIAYTSENNEQGRWIVFFEVIFSWALVSDSFYGIPYFYSVVVYIDDFYPYHAAKFIYVLYRLCSNSGKYNDRQIQ